MMSKQNLLDQINSRVEQMRPDLKSDMDSYVNKIEEPELLEILTYFEVVFSIYNEPPTRFGLDLIRHLPGKDKDMKKFKFSQSPNGSSKNWSSIIFQNSNQINFGLRFLKNNPLGIENYWVFAGSGIPTAPDISCLSYFHPKKDFKLTDEYYYNPLERPYLLMIGECKYTRITLTTARSIYGIWEDMTIIQLFRSWKIAKSRFINRFFNKFYKMLVVHISDELSDSVIEYFNFKKCVIIDGSEFLYNKDPFFDLTET